VIPKPLKPSDAQVADPKATRESLLGRVRTVGDLAVTELTLNSSAIIGCLRWAKDGTSFYCLESNGLLRRIALDGFKELKQLDLQRKAGWLDVSAEGLVVTLPDQQEVWVIDADQLRVKARIALPSLTRAVAAPESSMAVAAGGARNFGGSLYVLDLKGGQVVRQYDLQQDFPRAGHQAPVLTPDGKYLFTVGGIEQLFRFELNGRQLVLEESSPRICQGRWIGICVSPDGQYVCLPSGGGNYRGAPGHPEVPPYSTYVYPVTNLSRPALTLQQGAYPLVVGFDPKAGLMYGQNFRQQLLIFNLNGVKQKEYEFGDRLEVKQYLAHPEGRKLLLLTSDKLFYVELPKP
jgi:hypothetical protein